MTFAANFEGLDRNPASHSCLHVDAQRQTNQTRGLLFMPHRLIQLIPSTLVATDVHPQHMLQILARCSALRYLAPLLNGLEKSSASSTQELMNLTCACLFRASMGRLPIALHQALLHHIAPILLSADLLGFCVRPYIRHSMPP